MEPTPPKKRRVSDAPPPSFYKTRLSSSSIELPLPKKRRVSDAHPPSFYKTRLCLEFISTGCCPYGDACTNAHGRDDGFPCSRNSGGFGAVAMERWQDSTLRVEGSWGRFNHGLPDMVPVQCNFLEDDGRSHS